MERIPGSAMSPFSLVDPKGYIHGTSIHACYDIHLRNRIAAEEAGGTVNPADLSILGKRKDDGGDDYDDDDDDNMPGQASNRPGNRRGRPAKRQRPYAPGANGFDPYAPPFDWFTRTGNAPLDANPDVVWMFEDGRYFGYRMHTTERDPYVLPQLANMTTVEPAVTRAKDVLARLKRRATGNPSVMWHTPLYTGQLPQPAQMQRPVSPRARQAQGRVGHSAPASAARPPVPAFNPGPGMAAGLHPSVRQSSAAPVTQRPGTVSGPVNPGNRAIGNRNAPTAAMLPPSGTSSYGNGPPVTSSNPSGYTGPLDPRLRDTHAESTRSTESQVAPAAKVSSSKSSKEAGAANAKAGSHELKPGMLTAPQPATHPTVAPDQRTQNGAQHGPVRPTTNNTDGQLLSRKRDLADESEAPVSPKRSKLSTQTPAMSPEPSNVRRYQQPYAQVTGKTQSTKRRATGEHDAGSSPKKARVTNEPSTASRSSSYRPPAAITKKPSNAMPPPANKPANGLPTASQETSSRSSFMPDHRPNHPRPKASSPMPESTRKILESLPSAMPAPEKLAYMIQREGPEGYFAKQSKVMAAAFGSGRGADRVVAQQKAQKVSRMPPTAAFAPPSRVRASAYQLQSRSRSGSIPAATVVESSGMARRTARPESGMRSGASLPPYVGKLAQKAGSEQSGSIPAAYGTQRSAKGAVSHDGESVRQVFRASLPPSSSSMARDTNADVYNKTSVTSRRPGQHAHAASPAMSMVQGNQPQRSTATVRAPTSAPSTTRRTNANTTPPRHVHNDRDLSAPQGYHASPSTVPIIDLTAEDWSSQSYDAPTSYQPQHMAAGSAFHDPSTAHGSTIITTSSSAPAPETVFPVFHWSDFDWDAMPE